MRRHAASVVVIVGLLVAVIPVSLAATREQYTLEFDQTHNVDELGLQPQATLSITLMHGETLVDFHVWGARPNTVYTIWTVYNVLIWPEEVIDPSDPHVGSDPATGRPGFPPEGNGVAPLARLDGAFTSGMGLDPGATFVTNAQGDGEVQVRLDYNLLGGSENGPPVGNKDVILQCVPGPVTATGACLEPSKKIRVTTTWLRRYISQMPDPASQCANYDPSEPTTGFWQCIDPATVDPSTGSGLPWVFRFAFDHFRLAAHLDSLTHGFIGGSPEDHRIDMVGRRGCLTPSPPDETPNCSQPSRPRSSVARARVVQRGREW